MTSLTAVATSQSSRDKIEYGGFRNWRKTKRLLFGIFYFMIMSSCHCLCLVSRCLMLSPLCELNDLTRDGATIQIKQNRRHALTKKIDRIENWATTSGSQLALLSVKRNDGGPPTSSASPPPLLALMTRRHSQLMRKECSDERTRTRTKKRETQTPRESSPCSCCRSLLTRVFVSHVPGCRTARAPCPSSGGSVTRWVTSWTTCAPPCGSHTCWCSTTQFWVSTTLTQVCQSVRPSLIPASDDNWSIIHLFKYA